MIRRRGWKLVYQPLEDGYRLVLFDVVADSGCTRNVIERHPEIAQSLWQKLERCIPPHERVA